MTRQRLFPAVFLVGLVLAGSPGISHAAWPSDPNANLPVCTAAGNQEYPEIIADGTGGAIVTWVDYRSGSGDIYAQHLLASGAVDATWPANGRALCAAAGDQWMPALVSDGAGGAIVTWTDYRTSGGDIYAQHVLSSGAVDPVWPFNGRALGAGTAQQGLPVIASDRAGGAIVAWVDYRNGTLNPDIYAQHVRASGTVDPAWVPNGRALCTAPSYQDYPAIASDGAGGAIVAWHDYRNEVNIYALHVLASGAVDPAWPTNGRVLAASALRQVFPYISSDGSGGAIVTWEDGVGTSDANIYAQHVLASGLVDSAWPAAGRAVCAAGNDQYFTNVNPTGQRIASDGADGAIIAWIDDRDFGSDIYVQHLTGTGAVDPAWPADGRALCIASNSQQNPTVTSDGMGGAIVTWADYRSGLSDIYARHVLAGGDVDPNWPSDGRALCSASNHQTYPVIASDGTGGAIVAWRDGRNGYYDIYAQQVNAVGQLGGLPVTTISGTVSGSVWRRPHEPAGVRRIPGAQVEVIQGGFPLFIPTHTDGTGHYSITTSFTESDVVSVTASNDWLSVLDGSAPSFLELPVTEGPTIDFTWPATDAYSGDALNAYFIAESYGREFWGSHMQLPPTAYLIHVNNNADDIKSAGGAATSGTTMPRSDFESDIVQFEDAVCHEFVHAMMIQQLGSVLSCGASIGNTCIDVLSEAKGLDEGLADYFTYAYTGDPNFGADLGGNNRPLNKNPPSKIPWCDGYADTRNGYIAASAISGALYDLRSALNVPPLGAPAPPNTPSAQQFDQWLFAAVYSMRTLAREERTPLRLRVNLEATLLPGLGRAPAGEVDTAFNRHNIKDPHDDTSCGLFAAILSVSRTIVGGAQTIGVTWMGVPSAAFYRVYLQYGDSNPGGIGPGTVVGDSIVTTSFAYTDSDSAAHVFLTIVPVDATGTEGIASVPLDTRKLSVLTGVGDLTGTPVSARLTAWPTPFSTKLALRGSAPEGGRVSLSVYDVNGRLVRRVWSGTSSDRGGVVTEWDGRNEAGRRVSAGIYFVRFTGSRSVVQKKVMLLR